VEWESLIVRIVPILAFLVCITIVAELADGLGSRHWRALGGAARPALRCPGGASPRVALLVPLLLATSVTALWLAHR
jgi:hypothetical protein